MLEQSNYGSVIHNDQSLINLTLRHEWAELHPNWNWQALRLYRRFSELAAPRVMHYVGPRKPYDAHNSQKYYPQDLLAHYATFLTTHFPEVARPSLIPNAFLIRKFRALSHTIKARRTSAA